MAGLADPDHHRRGARRGPHHWNRGRGAARAARPAARSRSSPASRASSRSAIASPRSAAAARTPARSRWRSRSRPMSATSTPTSTASTPPTRASCRRRSGCPRSPTRRCWRWPRSAPRCCRRARSSSPWCTGCGRACCRASSRRRRCRAVGSADNWEDIGTIVCDEDEIVEQQVVSGIAYAKDEAKVTILKVADKPGVAAAHLRAAGRGQHQRRHDRAERVGGRQAYRHDVHGAGGRAAAHARGAEGRQGGDRLLRASRARPTWSRSR